jgi:putative ABC transport system permease protein
VKITWGENVGMALSAVWMHRFRSLLTILGIVIGITTVVTVSSLLTGLRQGVVEIFEELGPTSIFISRTSSGGGGGGPVSTKERRRKPLDPEYVSIIDRLCPAVETTNVAVFIPQISGGRPMMAKVPGVDTDNFSLVGDGSNAFKILLREISSGRLYTPEEERRGARVALLGSTIADTLFPGGHAVGKAIQVDGAEYTVLGVFAKAKGGFFGQNPTDSQITIPFRTARMRYPRVNDFTIVAKARSGMQQEAYEEVEGILRKIRHTPPGEPNDFSMSTPDQIMKQFDSVTGLIVMVSIAISGLGLLVGGIGVMNIMLVSVTERTREIGVRKAIGARRLDIITQFLVEAITLTGAGGTLGIVFSILVTLLIGALVPSLPSNVPPWAVVTGFGVSVAIGLFFGVWPAVKAARLDPVEALRYE